MSSEFVVGREEFPLIEADARERVVKTLQAGEDLTYSDF
jgi:hypothetical protein